MSKQQLTTRGQAKFLELGSTKKAVAVLAASLLTLSGVVGISQQAKADTSHCTPGNITLPVVEGKAVIATKAQLMHFSISQDLYRSSDVVLRPSIGDSIDVSDCDWSVWIPVGNQAAPFVGTFDGGGNTVIFRSDLTGATFQGGFFGQLDDAVVSDIHLSGTVIRENVSRNGGLAGWVRRTSITNSSFEGSVTHKDDDEPRLGGLIGYAQNSTITNSRVFNSRISGSEHVGGLIGQADYTHISGSSSTATVEGTNSVGGLVGYAIDTNVYRSNSSGLVKSLVGPSSFEYAGGLVGYFEGSDESFKILESYSTSDVEIQSTGDVLVGGFVGYQYGGAIQDSYSSGSIFTTSSPTLGSGFRVGGFIGEIEGWASTNTASVERVYSAGAVQISSADATKAGRFIGSAERHVRVGSSAYLSDPDEGHSAAVTRAIGVTAVQSVATLSEKSTADMKIESNFSPGLGWDFTSVWKMSVSSSDFKGFPVLQWQTASAVEQNPTGGGNFSTAPQATITSSGTNLNVNLNKTRTLRLAGSNLNLVTEARVGGKKATINFGMSNSGSLVISKLPLLPSGKYALTLLTPTGLVAGEVEVGITAKIARLRAIEASGQLNAKVRSVVRKQNLTYASAGTLRCWGVTTSSSATELALAQQKAELACAYAKRQNPELDVVASSRTGTGKPARNQVVKIRYLK